MGFTHIQLSALIRFPTFNDLTPLLKDVSKAIAPLKKKICICIDGLDSIVEQPVERRNYLFAGLINAAYKLHVNADLSHAFGLKLFLPEEFAHDARRIIWDQDKISRFSEFLHWSPKEFKQLIHKRLLPFSKSKSNDFLTVWHEHFPDKIRNEHHKLDEPSFVYFLRHTLYRPRQMLFHLQEVLDKWEEQSSSLRIDPSFIPSVVSKTNWELAQHVVDSLQQTFPHIDPLLKSFCGVEGILEVREVIDKIRKFANFQDMNDVKQHLHELISWGFMGVGDNQPGFLFAYSDPKVNHYPQPDALLAISPMFAEYCGTKPSSKGPVIPRTFI